MELDHLAVTCASLEEGAAWAEERLGVSLDPGGRHDRFGTWNRLLSLGPGLYFEVIAPEPGTTPAVPRWFGLEEAGAPRLGNWIARVPDLDAALAAAPPEAGEALALARGDLSWRVAVPPDGSLPWGGAFPTLIRWASGLHPAERLPDRGVRLLSLEVGHPRAPRLKALLSGLDDPRVTFVTADHPTLRARFSTPKGEVEL
ncbi:VOC family protein [Rubellimicrobium roseum]|uniref:VOC family protein n=1 Tax=Rubellimicrobium roseum TaxID=687525 RepID=A0A5C4NG72_9RHOB|nr:VOC family protein [Rubellimicrobium roseum]TNC71647.1 VOC family protein [Rubellimicrobium roseum]